MQTNIRSNLTCIIAIFVACIGSADDETLLSRDVCALFYKRVIAVKNSLASNPLRHEVHLFDSMNSIYSDRLYNKWLESPVISIVLYSYVGSASE